MLGPISGSLGKSAVIIVVAIDDGLWQNWSPDLEDDRAELLKRNVADFRNALDDVDRYNGVLERLLKGLRPEKPVV